ncbi:MAG: family transporter substrate-binding protein [Clostridia bacterium]|jgi:basic membrane protein A|nr:family transporter substrate-binding protein [Clostridia bacterium]
MKKSLALLLVVVMMMSLFVACTQKTPEPVATPEPTTPAPVETPKKTFGMVTDTGGLGDKSFNDSAWAGLEKAGTEFGVKPVVLQSTKQEDYEPNLGNMSQQADLTVGVGFLFENAMKAVSAQYPDKSFGVVDTAVDAPNVMSVLFKEHEGSFLVGVIAGLTTKSNVVGFVGGMELPTIQKFEAGFRAGVLSVKPDAKILINYTGVFDNPDKGKEVALAQYANKADVIYHASGACGIGVIQAADDKDFWAIGVDQDQSAISTKNKVLASMIKRVDTATYTMVKSLQDGTFKGQVVTLGLKEEGVGYSDGGNNVPAEVKTTVEKYQKAIIDGTIVVPGTIDELKAFKPTTL